jgi:HlyD family secretion protein
VKRGTVKEEVSVTGKVTPFQQADIGFEKGGTVAAVNIKVGDTVKRGQTIAALNDRQTYASLLSARANLSAAEANLADSQTNTQIDYENARKNAIDTGRTSYIKVENVIVGQTDTFFRNGTSIYPTITIAVDTYTHQREIENKRLAVTSVLNAWKVRNISATPDDAEAYLRDVRGYLATISDYMNTLTGIVFDLAKNNSSSQSVIDSYNSTINSANSNFNSAVSGITTAENAITSAAPKSIKALQARVEQARADVANYQAQYAKSLVVAPFDGIITKADPQPGDLVAGSQAVFSMIGSEAFKVEANVAEADIAKVQVGQKASITLDAYGPDDVFPATVISIDPAETVIDGVPTYKTSFQFGQEDSRVKSGMTANIDIEGMTRENVLAIPQRAVVSKNGRKYVTVQTASGTENREVTLGLRGFDGSVEIVKGLNEGDMVLTNPS